MAARKSGRRSKKRGTTAKRTRKGRPARRVNKKTTRKGRGRGGRASGGSN